MSVSRLTKTILVIVAAAMLAVVSASMFERPLPDPKPSQGSERKQMPGFERRPPRGLLA